MSTNQISETSLRIERDVAAPVEKVFQAWTDPEMLKQWMGPGPLTCPKADVNLKVGGTYAIHMVGQMDGEEQEHIAIGKYTEIVPNQRLQFTWSWKGGPMPETLVTLEFEKSGNGTRLILTHKNFPAKEAAEKHNQGWVGCLDKLVALFA